MKLAAFQKKIKFKFHNPQLLARALVHRSYLNETKGKSVSSNERMEFLGDAVLEFIISDWLFKVHPQYPEGVLTNLRSNIVRTSSLAELATQLGIGKYLLMSKGEKESGGQENPSILADTTEAIIGAVYLDQGVKAAETFIKTHFQELFTKISQQGEFKDPKSILQEKAQAKEKLTPVYHILGQQGPDHKKTFIAGVYIGKRLLAKGKGKSKQSAEENAARQALKLKPGS